MPNQIFELITNCWSHLINKRPTSKEICETLDTLIKDIESDEPTEFITQIKKADESSSPYHSEPITRFTCKNVEDTDKQSIHSRNQQTNEESLLILDLPLSLQNVDIRIENKQKPFNYCEKYAEIGLSRFSDFALEISRNDQKKSIIFENSIRICNSNRIFHESEFENDEHFKQSNYLGNITFTTL
ncbi:457_t:CDS:2 [Dentiscutata erythropus]|uniref:457_t:CDS:1 n=1 Tax=Dentiscutata erythropus TaxID=1348616 RepID=A0A9N9GJT3_9GLOM|nr:457_t:CDS:2 [Dentiscutata erythropus]